MKSFILAFKYAFNGIFRTVRNERNIKIHILAVIVVVVMGIIYRINTIEWIICLLLFGLVISSELINSAVEHTVDLCTKEKNELAKFAKDAAAGAVLVNAIISIIIACIIWIPKIV